MEVHANTRICPFLEVHRIGFILAALFRFRTPSKALKKQTLIKLLVGLLTLFCIGAGVIARRSISGPGRVQQLKRSLPISAPMNSSSESPMPKSAVSVAFQEIASLESPFTQKISLIHQALDDRFEAEGVEVGFNKDRKSELTHMTRPEWVIRTLNCYFCGCENSGNLYSESEMGIGLIPEMEEVGLSGCAKALRLIKQLEDESELLNQRNRKGEISDDEAENLGRQLQSKMEGAEEAASAEDWDECCEALWKFALLHSNEILAAR